MRVAIVYDRVNKIGGAERVLLSLHSIFPKAVLYTSVYDKEHAQWAKIFTVKTSLLQKIPFLRRHHEYIPYLMPLAFESFDVAGYDLVISVTSEAAKGVIVAPPAKHICICLTPTRYLWSGYKTYFRNPVMRFFTYPIVLYLKKWDLIASQRPDSYIAISHNVAKRIKKYYKRDSVVIYPPSDLLLREGKSKNKPLEENYFLVVSRLIDYKRIDLAVRACNKIGAELVVIGEGKEEGDLHHMAGPSIHFKGKVSDEELKMYYKYCNALIFPGEEDFGITMVEANAHGKPVVAYKGGGAMEIIQKGKTGEFFDRQTVASLASVLKNFKTNRYNSEDCKTNAKRFSEKNFQKEFQAFLRGII